MIGKKVSNGWKTCAIISNDLKKIGTFWGDKRDKRGNKGRGTQELSDNYDNFRQLFSTLKDMETASRTKTRLESGWGATTWTPRNNSLQGGSPKKRLLLSPFVAAAELVEGIFADGGTEERGIGHTDCRQADPVQFRQDGQMFLHRLLRAESVIRVTERRLLHGRAVHGFALLKTKQNKKRYAH